jgi:hypothetical protein
MELEDTACEHCGAMAGACADYPHCAGGPTEAERLRGALNRLGERNSMLERALRAHHSTMGAINYCRVCGGHFNWEEPLQAVGFPASGEAKP